MVSAPEAFSYCLHGADETRVATRHESEIGQDQQAGIQMAAVRAFHERSPVRVPCGGPHVASNGLSCLQPTTRIVCELQPACYSRQAVARRPAHHTRARVYSLAPAILPDPGVRNVVQRQCPPPHGLQATEIADVALTIQARVEEVLSRCEDDSAIGIVLSLPVRLVSHPDRRH